MTDGIVTPKERHCRKMDRMAQAIVAIDALRGFRPIAAHAYDGFDEDGAAVAAAKVETLLAGMAPALARFRAAIDPDRGWSHGGRSATGPRSDLPKSHDCIWRGVESGIPNVGRPGLVDGRSGEDHVGVP